MFDFIRKHLKLVMIGFFPLVIFAFVLVGIDPSMLHQRSAVVAKVGGVEITQNEWDYEHTRFADLARAQNSQISPALLDSPAQRYAVLERMVRDQVMTDVVRERRYLVSNGLLARELQNQPEIAALRDANGRIDTTAYREMLRANGLTAESYEANVRYQIALQQVLGIVQQSSLATPVQSALAANALFQRRNVGIQRFAPADFAAKVAVTDDALRAYYDAHQSQFQRPELLDVQYVALNLSDVANTIQIAEDELRSYYDNNKAAYAQSKEKRQARHILYATDASMSSEQRAQIRAKADAALAKLRQDPGQFAAIAKAESEDPGTRDAGGDLGFFERGAMVPEFDAAVFSMEQGAISEVIPTEYGFHIIELVKVDPAKIPAYEELRERLLQDVKNNQARSQFIEKAEQMRNLAHEQPNSLQPLVDELGLRIQTANGIAQAPAPDAPKELQSPAVLDALFAPRAKQDKENIEAVDTGSEQIVTARVQQVHPAQVQPFEQVREQVQQLYVAQESAKLAQAAGEAALQSGKADAAAIRADESVAISRQNAHGLDAASIEQIMLQPVASLPQLLGLPQNDGSYLVVQVKDVAPLLDPSQDAQEQQLLQAGYDMQLAQMLTAAETSAYYETLKHDYRAEFLVQRPKP